MARIALEQCGILVLQKKESTAIGMLVAFATGCAFAGSYGGSRLISKVTLGFVQKVVGVMLLVLGTAIATGWV